MLWPGGVAFESVLSRVRRLVVQLALVGGGLLSDSSPARLRPISSRDRQHQRRLTLWGPLRHVLHRRLASSRNGRQDTAELNHHGCIIFVATIPAGQTRNEPRELLFDPRQPPSPSGSVSRGHDGCWRIEEAAESRTFRRRRTPWLTPCSTRFFLASQQAL